MSVLSVAVGRQNWLLANYMGMRHNNFSIARYNERLSELLVLLPVEFEATNLLKRWGSETINLG